MQGSPNFSTTVSVNQTIDHHIQTDQPIKLNELPNEVLCKIIGLASGQGHDFQAVARLASTCQSFRDASQVFHGIKLELLENMTGHINSELTKLKVPERYQRDVERYVRDLRFHIEHFPQWLYGSAVNSSAGTAIQYHDLHLMIRGESQVDSLEEKAVPTLAQVQAIPPFTVDEIKPLAAKAKNRWELVSNLHNYAPKERIRHLSNDLERMSAQVKIDSIRERREHFLQHVSELPLVSRCVQYAGLAVLKGVNYVIPERITNPIVGGALGFGVGALISSQLPLNGDVEPVLQSMPLLVSFSALAILVVSLRSDPYSSLHY